MVEQMQQQAAHRVGGASAVVQQLGEIGIAFLPDVLDEGVEQVAEQLQRQAIVGNDRPQAQEHRVLRRFASRSMASSSAW
jgi:hypothetical protein